MELCREWVSQAKHVDESLSKQLGTYETRFVRSRQDVRPPAPGGY